MWKYLVIAAVAAGAIWLYTAPGASRPPERPSGRLVLGLHPPERIAVVDVGTGRTVSRPLPGGTLCHGEIHVLGGRVVLPGTSERRGAALSADPALRGRPRAIGEAHVFVPEAHTGAFSPDGSRLATGQGGRIALMDLRKGSASYVLRARVAGAEPSRGRPPASGFSSRAHAAG